MPGFPLRRTAQLGAAVLLVSVVVLAVFVLAPRVGAGAAKKATIAEVAKARRVVDARTEKGEAVRSLFETRGLDYPPEALYLRAFKRDAELELWAGDREAPLTLVKVYPICAPSGILGPKRRQGDLQVPEGFYAIIRFNPRSRFHLSLGIDYPNRADRILGVKGRLGGKIFIHGSCVTIGCIPLEDEPIEEVFLVALDARRAGLARIPVHIFPARMDEKGMATLRSHAERKPELLAFWEELRPAYGAFERTHRVPRVSIAKKTGRYTVHPVP